MANRSFFQFQKSLQRELVNLKLKMTIGSSGAVASIQESKGIVSVTKETGAGNYTILLKDSYNRLMGMSMVSISGSSAATAPEMNIVSEQVSSSTVPKIVIQLRSDAGAATNPASGEVIMVDICLCNASN